MQTLFDEAASRVITEIERRERLPSGVGQIRQATQPVEEALNRMPRIASEFSRESAERSFQAMLSKIAREGWDWVGRPRQLDSRIVERIGERSFVASEQSMRRIRGDVIEKLQSIAESGINSRQAVPELAEVFTSMRDFELERIARTEVHSAAQDAAQETMTSAGVRYHKWSAANDERTRQTHAANDGLIARIGDTYPNGLRYAGDRMGPIGEWINCRCTMIPVIVTARGKQPPLGRRHFRESEMV